MSLASLTKADFEPHVGTEFRVDGVPGRPLQLVEIVSHDQEAPNGRAAFSLFFRGPPGDHLPQRIYPLQHPSLGALEIFIVPLGPDETGHLYEAAFS